MNNDDCWLIDCDGVLWLSDQPIAGAGEALRRIADSGRRIAFFTNDSFHALDELVSKIEHIGFHTDCESVLTAAQAGAALVQPGERALVLGGAGIVEALATRGVEALSADEDPSGVIDAVVVGLDPLLSYQRLAVVARAVLRGARLIGTNADAMYPTRHGPMPGSGTLVAAVAYATGVEPIFAGKPHQPAADLARRRLGEVNVVVGDNARADGGLARALGARFALVHSGTTSTESRTPSPTPDLEAESLAVLVDEVLSGRSIL